jgi:hypothetical protein
VAAHEERKSMSRKSFLAALLFGAAMTGMNASGAVAAGPATTTLDFHKFCQPVENGDICVDFKNVVSSVNTGSFFKVANIVTGRATTTTLDGEVIYSESTNSQNLNIVNGETQVLHYTLRFRFEDVLTDCTVSSLIQVVNGVVVVNASDMVCREV